MKTRSTSASCPVKGWGTKPTTVKWSISILLKYKLNNLTVVNIFPSLSTAKYFLASSPLIAMRSGPTERNCKTAEM